MSDTASSSRPVDPVPVSQNAAAGDPENPQEAGSSTARPQPQLVQNQPVQDDEPTIISTRPPIASATPISDSAYRILQGRILPGDKLGHFELVEYIGGGGMGRVFRAIDTSLARSVALKVLSPDQATDEETLLRFRNEAQSAARLDHENIARVHYVGEDHGLHYIVFEFIEGMNIRTLVRQKGPLALSEAVSYTLQVAEALVHAAKRDVVHRDIKPSNVLITPDGRAKLIDMGLARLRRLSTSDADLTASGVTLGTFDYISPEQARDPRLADVRSDIYSLGCTFFYTLASRPPFPEGTVLQKLLQHQGDQPPRIQDIRPELPEETDRILGKMLAKDPRNRYQEPERLVHDLLVLAEQVGLHTARAGGSPVLGRAVAALYQHLPWIAPIAALVCIVTALHFFWSAEAEVNEPLPAPRALPPQPMPGPSGPPSPTTAPGHSSAEPSLPDHEGTQDGAVQPRPGQPEGTGHAATPSPATATKPSREPVGLTTTEPLCRGIGPGGDSGVGLDAISGGLATGESASHAIGVPPNTGDPVAVLTAAKGTPAAGAEPETSIEPASKPVGLLVVGDAPKGKKTYQTLGDACSAAVNGDVIELRYNGSREERPIKLANLKVTVRAGEGYHPVVAFRPNEVDPIKYSRRMFTLAGGRLTLINLALEFRVPREIPADDWAMVEIQGNQTVRLDGCTLTIRNASNDQSAYHPEVAFFLTKAAPGADLAMGGANSAETPATSIGLTDCVVRGEADFLRCLDCQPVHLDWKNGLLTTTERLLLLSGGQKTPSSTDALRIYLWHLTAVVQHGLCRMIGSELNPHLLRLHIKCEDSILVGSSDAVLIEQVGMDKTAEFYQLVAWHDARNFYENFNVFGRICGVDHQPLTEPMDFEDWQGYWGDDDEEPSKVDEIEWRQPPSADRPLHTHTPLDYALDKPANGDSANGNVNRRRDVGCEIERLPPCTLRIMEKPLKPDATPAAGRGPSAVGDGTGGVKRTPPAIRPPQSVPSPSRVAPPAHTRTTPPGQTGS